MTNNDFTGIYLCKLVRKERASASKSAKKKRVNLCRVQLLKLDVLEQVEANKYKVVVVDPEKYTEGNLFVRYVKPDVCVIVENQADLYAIQYVNESTAFKVV